MIDPVQHVAEAPIVDEDLAWVDRQIYLAENEVVPVSEDARAEMLARLDRLWAVRRKLAGETP